MKKLFGGQSQSSSSASGFSALGRGMKQPFYRSAESAEKIMADPNQYFRPMDLSPEELAAQGMINAEMNPQAYQASINQYLSPFRDIVTQDINKAYEDQYGGLNQLANEAGAFGSSRYDKGLSQLERSRLDAITNALQGQYNTAINQRQQGIQNLLGFGGFQRALDLSQRQALPAAISNIMSSLSPVLNTGTSTSTQKISGGLMGALGAIGGLATGIGGLTSAAGLTGGFDPFTGITWNSGRVA